MLGNSELRAKLQHAKKKLAMLETSDQDLCGQETEAARQMVEQLEGQCGVGGEDPMSVEPIPGAESGLLSKFNMLLSRHQVAMAQEERDFAATTAGIEAQIVELQAQSAAALKQHTAQVASNDALHAALLAKVHALAPTLPKEAEVEKLCDAGLLDQALSRKFTPAWLQEHGMQGLTPQMVRTMLLASSDVLGQVEALKAEAKAQASPADEHMEPTNKRAMPHHEPWADEMDGVL